MVRLLLPKGYEYEVVSIVPECLFDAGLEKAALTRFISVAQEVFSVKRQTQMI
jgi:hypothetical protein